jgi:hypothetical protein
MWFRRKKKTEADTALTDTLRSLQTLLDEESPGKDDEAPAVPETTPQREMVEKTDGVESSLKADERNISNAVASDEHLDWDFNVDLAAEELAGDVEKIDPLESLELEDVPDLDTSDIVEAVSTRGDGEAEVEPIEEPPAGRSTDNIPVLNNIAYLPEREENDRLDKAKVLSETPFMDQCLKDIRKRLKRNDLPTMTLDQEQQLRTVLTSLLAQKTSGKSES